MFALLPVASAVSPGSESCAYRELGDGQLMDILQGHIDSLGSGLVLFRGAIEHTSRLARVMVSISLLYNILAHNKEHHF